MTDKVYGDFTQEELDWQYNNRERVPEHATLTGAYKARGDAFIQKAPHAVSYTHLTLPTIYSV